MLHSYLSPLFQGIHSSSAILNHPLKASQYSSGAALPVPDLSDPYLEGTEGLYLLQARGGRRMRKRKDIEIFQVTVPTAFSVFLALPTSSGSWVAAEPVPGHSDYSQVQISKVHQQRHFQIRRHQDCCLLPGAQTRVTFPHHTCGNEY